MRLLSGKEEEKAIESFKYGARLALGASCRRSPCGAWIEKDGLLIGKGVNGPPNNDESQRRCLCSKDLYDLKVTDKTCCVHAEQRAMIDGLRTNPSRIVGARLYFIRLDENKKPKRSGDPYCTICSKMALDVGLAEFVLWRKEGICVYDTDEYNLVSFQYKG